MSPIFIHYDLSNSPRDPLPRNAQIRDAKGLRENWDAGVREGRIFQNARIEFEVFSESDKTTPIRSGPKALGEWISSET